MGTWATRSRIACNVATMIAGRLLVTLAAFCFAQADVEVTGNVQVQGSFRKPVEEVKVLEQQAALELSEAFTENTSQNPYMHSTPTAEALAFIFISVAIVICWIECCGAGKKWATRDWRLAQLFGFRGMWCPVPCAA